MSLGPPSSLTLWKWQYWISTYFNNSLTSANLATRFNNLAVGVRLLLRCHFVLGNPIIGNYYCSQPYHVTDCGRAIKNNYCLV
jgi:hypothetical protein